MKKRNLAVLIFFMCNLLIAQSIELHTQTNYENLTTSTDSYKTFFLIFEGGIHGGEKRFSIAPIGYFGVGYKVSKSINLKIEYCPIFLKISDKNDPKYIYNGKELMSGEKITLNNIFFTGDINIIDRFNIGLGISPVEIFSLRMSFNYNFYINDSFSFTSAYNLLLVGRPIYTTPSFYIRSNSLTIGIIYNFI